MAGWKLALPEDCPPARDADVLVTSSWDEAEKKLAAGGRVLFVPRNSDLDWTSPPLDIVPVFWNRLMGPAWGRMLGLWIDRKVSETKSHALDGFPTSSNFDWQWAEIIHNVRAVNLDRLPPELEPVVWAIDDWNRNYKLGVIFEGAVGDGRLLVSAFDVTKPADSNPVARQLRNSLLNYMRSDCFQPQVSVSPAQMRSLFFDTRIMKKLGAVAQVGGASANTAIDGDPNTFVLVGDQRANTRAGRYHDHLSRPHCHVRPGADAAAKPSRARRRHSVSTLFRRATTVAIGAMWCVVNCFQPLRHSRLNSPKRSRPDTLSSSRFPASGRTKQQRWPNWQ